MKGERLGEFEEVVLLAAYGLDGEAYGVTIQQQLEASIRRNSTIGAVYAALDRLERKGYLSSRIGGATHERGGRRKRFFRATKAGVSALESMRADRQHMWDMVEGGR
jgi:PadR family transcriptional regulator PadR